MKVAQTKANQKHSIDDNMIPLINIVFLMLIFFMVAGHISQKSAIKVALPYSISEGHQQDDALVLMIDSNGELGFENKPIPVTAAREMIEKRYQEAQDKEAFKLLLKVDGKLPVDQLRTILSQIKQVGIKRVSIATQQLVNEK